VPLQRGQLGPFANAYWGHPAYKLPPEANLMAVAHYLQALEWQRDFIKVHALLGGKNPHPQSFLVGGMSTPVDPNSQAALNIHTVNALHKLLEGARAFVDKVYIPDVLAVAPFYKDWAGIGAGVGKALDRLSQYYITLAEKMFPIIEVDAGRIVEVVLTRGVTLGLGTAIDEGDYSDIWKRGRQIMRKSLNPWE